MAVALVFFSKVSIAAPQTSPEIQSLAEAGIAAVAKDDLPLAKRKFKQLLDADPDNITGLINFGLVLFRLGEMGEAETALKRAVRLNPDAAVAWLTLGAIHNRQSELDAALAACSRAVFLDPKNPDTHSALANTLFAKGWYSAAEDELRKVLELKPDSADGHYNLALACLQRVPPATELARRHYQRARELGAKADAEIEKKLALAEP